MWPILWRRYVPFINTPLFKPGQKVADGVCLDAYISNPDGITFPTRLCPVSTLAMFFLMNGFIFSIYSSRGMSV